MTATTSETSPSPVAHKAPGHNERPTMTRRETLEALSGILLGMFVSILATSVVSSSLPKIITSLHGSGTGYTWVVTATLLTTTISTPIWGKLSDLVDRKLLIQLALIVSVVSSALAGLSQNTGTLIAFRALQGIGAGGLTALATVLIADIISPRERGKYMGLMGGVMAISMVGGPILGGTLTDSIGWRWNFFVGLPFAIAAIVVLQRTLHLPAMTRRTAKIDYWGAAFISVGVALLLLWVTFAAKGSFGWVSWQSATMIGGAVVSLAVAVVVELRTGEPMIPLKLFRNRTLVLAVVASISVGIAMFGTSVFLSQYMQISRGKTPTQSGLITVPMVLGIVVTSVFVGRLIAKTGRYKRFMLAGGLLLTIGLAMLSTIDYRTSFVPISIYLFLVGLGVGMLMQNLVLAVQNTLDPHQVGSGTATVAFFRTLGGAIGVSVLGAVMQTRVTTDIHDGLVRLGTTTSGLAGGALPDLSTVPAPVRVIIESAYGDGIAEIFLIAAPLALVSFLCVLFLKEIPLGTRSGVEQRLAAEAGTDELAGDPVVDEILGADEARRGRETAPVAG